MLSQIAMILQRVEAQAFGRKDILLREFLGRPQACESPISKFDGGIQSNPLAIEHQHGVATDPAGFKPAKAKRSLVLIVCLMMGRLRMERCSHAV